MAIDYRSELRRPVSLALLAVAALGWIALAVLAWNSSERARDDRRRISLLTVAETNSRGELEKQRQTSGTLAELQAKTTAAQGALAQAEQSQTEARTRLAEVEQNLEMQRRTAAEAAKEAEAQSQRLGEVQTQVRQATERLTSVRNDFTSTEQSITTRTQELATVGRRLEEARQGGLSRWASRGHFWLPDGTARSR